MSLIGISTPPTRTTPVVIDGRPGVKRSLLRASVLARLGGVGVVSAVLWLSILWALA